MKYSDYHNESVSGAAFRVLYLGHDYDNSGDPVRIIEDLTDKIRMIEIVLKDKKGILENLDALTSFVHNVKMYGVVNIISLYHKAGEDIPENLINVLSQEEKEDLLLESKKHR